MLQFVYRSFSTETKNLFFPALFLKPCEHGVTRLSQSVDIFKHCTLILLGREIVFFFSHILQAVGRKLGDSAVVPSRLDLHVIEKLGVRVSVEGKTTSANIPFAIYYLDLESCS